MQYSFVDDAERFRESQDIAYRRWEASIEDAIDAVPFELADMEPSELTDWIYGNADQRVAQATDRLISAVTRLGACNGKPEFASRDGVLHAAQMLADLMIEVRQAEVSK